MTMRSRPRKGKSLIQLRVKKVGTCKRFTTRLFMKSIGPSTSEIEERLKAKFPKVELEVLWDQSSFIRWSA